jgi:hypothetical protein
MDWLLQPGNRYRAISPLIEKIAANGIAYQKIVEALESCCDA